MEQSEYFRNRDIRDIILIIILILFLICLVSMYFQIKDESFKCAKNPLSYGYSNLQRQNQYANIDCSCTLYQFGQSAVLIFNENESRFLNKNLVFNINFSK